MNSKYNQGVGAPKGGPLHLLLSCCKFSWRLSECKGAPRGERRPPLAAAVAAVAAAAAAAVEGVILFWCVQL